jgi:hypothetical protein
VASAEGVTVEAWEAELYLRCPRRYHYDRVLSLPAAAGAAPYVAFKRMVQRALRHAAATPGTPPSPKAAAEVLAAAWAEVGPDPAHPHTPLYRDVAEEIVTRCWGVRDGEDASAPATRPPEDAGAPASFHVVLPNGTVCVRADGRDEAGAWERRTFRKPPKDEDDAPAAAPSAPPEPRLSLLQEAVLRQTGAGAGRPVVRLRFLRTGMVLPLADKPKQRAKHLAEYDRALQGIRLRVFPAAPADPDDCPTCPYFFICPA